MEIVVQARGTEIADRFRTHVEDKLAKVSQFAPRAQRIDVELTFEPNPRQADHAERIEITVRDKGPVIRAEASASDRYGALDLATGKLLERLRRHHDRVTTNRRRRNEPMPPPPELAELTAPKPPADGPHGDGLPADPPVSDSPAPAEKPGDVVETQLGDSPVVVRDKLYEPTAMSVDEALYEMEMVGHPFYLFIDSNTNQPCVVYRRKGWTYGVLRLDATVEGAQHRQQASA